MPGNSVAVQFDSREFEQAIREIENELPEAHAGTVTLNGQRLLRYINANSKIRTGNFRSALITPWRAIGTPGRPSTLLDEGEKEVAYTMRSSGRMRTARLMSKGTYEDKRKDQNPSFSFSLFAAEWRGRGRENQSNSVIRDALQASLLSASEAKQVAGMMARGASYIQVWSYIVSIFSGIPAGRTWLINNASGYWRPYSHYLEYNRGTVDYRFSDRYQKIFTGHRGRAK